MSKPALPGTKSRWPSPSSVMNPNGIFTGNVAGRVLSGFVTVVTIFRYCLPGSRM